MRNIGLAVALHHDLATVELVVDGSQAEVVLHLLERLLDLTLDHVLLPEYRRIGLGHYEQRTVVL